MKVLKKWFRSTDGAPVEKSQPDRATGAIEACDEDTSFNWRALDASSSSIFDSPDTHRVRILKAARERPANDDNPGYDPYDTGRFISDDDG